MKDSLEDILSNRSRGVLPRKYIALLPNPELEEKETGRVREARSRAAIPVAWTFMSEILAKHRRIIERLQSHNNFRFDRVSWSCDGHECPSYKLLDIHEFVHTQNCLTKIDNRLIGVGLLFQKLHTCR